MVDHLTVYMSKANQFRSAAKAYELFSRFLTKAAKYYSLSRLRTWASPLSQRYVNRLAVRANLESMSKPWKIRLQVLVDKNSPSFLAIKDVGQFHGSLDGNINLIVGQKSLQNSRKSIARHEQSLASLMGVEELIEQVRTPFIRFSKEHDVQQTSNILRQCVDKGQKEPEKCCGPTTNETRVQIGARTQGINRRLLESNSHYVNIGTETEQDQIISIEPKDHNALHDRIFSELRDFQENLSQIEKVIEQAPEMHGHRSRLRNILKIDKVMAWVELDTA